MNREERIEQLLSDRAGVPWEVPSVGLRERTMAAIGGTQVMAGGMWARRWMPMAAAVVLVGMGWAVVYRMAPPPVAVSRLQLDPSPILGSALWEATASAETSLTMEAKQFLDDADRLTRRVVAQLPFTGAR